MSPTRQAQPQRTVRAAQIPVDKLFIINISFGNDNDAKRIFVNSDGREFAIERGKDVVVPYGVIEKLDNAVIGVPQPKEDNPDEFEIVQRKRFTYSIVGEAIQ